jgi:plasmid stability protein
MTFRLQLPVRIVFFSAVAIVLAACTGLETTEKPGGAPGQPTAPATPQPASLASYFELLDRMAPGDIVRQSAALTETQTNAQLTPTAANRLRYALALGAAGHTHSNPVEARRLITELLAGEHGLSPPEVSLANAFLREYDARVALYADLARQREESDRRFKALDTEDDRRYNVLNAETQRLKKALLEAERKLEAVAEMERALTPEGQ